MTEPTGTATDPNQNASPVPSETVQQVLQQAFDGVPTGLLEAYVNAHERRIRFNFTADHADPDHNSFSYSNPPGARREGVSRRPVVDGEKTEYVDVRSRGADACPLACFPT